MKRFVLPKFPSFLMAISLLLALVGATIVTAPSAQAASCTAPYHTASWGKGKLCATFNSSQHVTHIWGSIVDTKTDGWCVSLRYWTSGGELSTAVKACNLNQVYNYDVTKSSSNYITGVELSIVDYDNGNLIHWLTLYPTAGGGGCISPAIRPRVPC